MVFLALLLVTPVLFAGSGNVASSDTVNGWYFRNFSGDNPDSVWTYLVDSSIFGSHSQIFGIRSKGATRYFWVKKLSKFYKIPREVNVEVFVEKYTGTDSRNRLMINMFLGRSNDSSEFLIAFGGIRRGSGLLLPRPDSSVFGLDSVDYMVFGFNFEISTELVTAELVFNDILFVYNGFQADSLVLIDDGGEPKFPQFNISTPKINFGLVPKNERKLDSVTVFNTGDAPLQISKIWTSDSVFSAKCSVETIAPQASTNVVVEFVQDSVPGLKRAKLYIEHNGSGELDSIELVADFMTSVGDDKNLSPVEYGLSQNYPNPFNPSTKINYSVKSRQWAKLTVYDLLGKEIAVLVDGEQQAGEHFAIFNAQNLPSGTYIYRFQTGDFTAVKKMLLLK
jgi:hypothetical protein